jgi:2-alkyl-3-oxoalkanoate reductase
MRILIAGASGALGRRLVPVLVERGHEVTGTTTTERRTSIVAELGATPAVADGLDPEAVARVVGEAEPDVIVHQMTALAGDLDLRRIDTTFATTNRLRTDGTDNLLSAARAVGARRFVAQSFAGWPYAKTGGPVKDEDDPLDADPPRRLRGVLAAIRHLERSVTGATGLEGVVLRYGGFYGPGTSIQTDPDGVQVEAVRKRRMPIVGSGAGIFSLIHIDDAAGATVAAIEAGSATTGIFNVVDDDPAAVREWLPHLAQAIGAGPPRRVPGWLGRLVAGEAAVSMMTETRGASNARARRELGWEPRYRSWRQGFAEGLSASAVEATAGSAR